MQGVETSLGYVHTWVIDPSTVMFTQAGTLSGPRIGFAVLLSTQRQAWELTQQDTGQFLPVSSPSPQVPAKPVIFHTVPEPYNSSLPSTL